MAASVFALGRCRSERAWSGDLLSSILLTNCPFIPPLGVRLGTLNAKTNFWGRGTMLKCTTLLALAILSSIVHAQDRGTIRGTVTDQSGAPAPEAQVTTRNVNTGLKQSANRCEECPGVFHREECGDQPIFCIHLCHKKTYAGLID